MKMGWRVGGYEEEEKKEEEDDEGCLLRVSRVL